MVELALAAPLFAVVLLGIVVLGIGVFYQQELTNVAREAARYAAIHSATAQCPTVSNLAPDPAQTPQTYYACDAPGARWPEMTAFAEARAFGLPASGIELSACWSGYWYDADGNGILNLLYDDYDAPPTDLGSGAPNPFGYCTIPSNTGGTIVDVDPRTAADQIACTSPMPTTTTANDMASSLSASSSLVANEVTVFACFNWRPPAAGFLLVPETVTLRAVITEKLEYQQ
jgi:hypothetical protein